MSDFDEKLKEELRVSIKILLEHLSACGYHEDDPVNYIIMFDCFKRAGWIKPSFNVYTSPNPNEQTEEQKALSDKIFANSVPFVETMTGQEWYEKFEAELNNLTFLSLQTDKGEITDLLGRSTVIAAAKKTSGIK